MKTSFLVLFLFSLMSFSTLLFAENPGFFVDSEKGAIELSDVDVHTKVVGPFAETTLTLAFKNNSNEMLQGNFKLNLPGGVLIREFWLKIGKEWKLGELKEKHEARKEYEEIVRRKIDPAVLSWVNGSIYQARIYPFLAKGKRWIKLKYWQDLSEVSSKWDYTLPLPKGKKLDSFKIKLDVNAPSLKSVDISENYDDILYLKANKKDKTKYSALVNEKNKKTPGDLVVKINHTEKRDKTWIAKHQTKGEYPYFAIHWLEDLDDVKRDLGDELLVYIDTSLSMRGVKKEKLKKLITHFLKQHPDKKPKIYQFNASVSALKPNFNIKDIRFDGGSDFIGLFKQMKKHLGNTRNDIVVISDAVPTMQEIEKLKGIELKKSQLFFIPANNSFSRFWTSRMVQEHQGRILPGLEKTIEDNWSDFSKQSWQITDVKFDRKGSKEIFPEVPSNIGKSGVKLAFRSGSKAPKSVTVKLTAGKSVKELKADLTKELIKNPAAENLWAYRKLFELVSSPLNLNKEILAHAKRYKIISPRTSFIVKEEFPIPRMNPFSTFGGDELGLGDDEEIEEMEGEVIGGPQGNSARRGPRGPAPGIGGPGLSRGGALGSGGGGGGGGAATGAPSSSPRPIEESSSDDLELMEDDADYADEDILDEDADFEPMGGSYTDLKETKRQARITLKRFRQFTKQKWNKKKLIQKYYELKKENLNNIWFFIEFTETIYKAGDKKLAKRIFSNLFEIQQEDGKSLRALGLYGAKFRFYKWGAMAFKLLTHIRPEEPQNYRDLAWLLVEQKKYKEALKVYTDLKNVEWHGRFPGLKELVAKEVQIMEVLAKKKKWKKGIPKNYAYVTWNSDNNDLDLIIYETPKKAVYYGNKKGKGELSSDYRTGYGPEAYQTNAKETKDLNFFSSYYSVDTTVQNKGIVVKFSFLRDIHKKVPKISVKAFPHFNKSELVDLGNGR